MGEVAAIGLVLAIRLAGDDSRPRGLRVAAACASAPLSMGLYLTFSRGALFACAAGIVTLIVLAAERTQLRAIVLSLGVAALAAACAAPFSGVTALAGNQAARERQGAVALVALVVIVVAAGLAERRLLRDERRKALRLPRQTRLIALGVICAGLALAIIAGAKEGTSEPAVSGASRYVTLQSNRFAYWRVALRAFSDEPLRGVGAGGWAVWWLRYRPVAKGAQDAHSLPLQTLAELGLIGAALLLAVFAGIGLAARAAYRAAPALAAGSIAALVVYIAHAPLDWDWQMPAVTLIAIVLAGSLLALAEPEAEGVTP
jgi:O-antigen ligase